MWYVHYHTPIKFKLLKTLLDVVVAECCIFETSLASFWIRRNSIRKYHGSQSFRDVTLNTILRGTIKIAFDKKGTIHRSLCATLDQVC